eukprot:TRINITY_DN38044_c0_g1_i1.p1 TRINITY_DN38044_c0_g1~~TRINITY_DN38044_c0_g1_i1.p1  ORF type:complete len:746 (-),score=90.40 TRINITY_DN38044_c0_g1_i1:29-2221(-)
MMADAPDTQRSASASCDDDGRFVERLADVVAAPLSMAFKDNIKEFADVLVASLRQELKEMLRAEQLQVRGNGLEQRSSFGSVTTFPHPRGEDASRSFRSFVVPSVPPRNVASLARQAVAGNIQTDTFDSMDGVPNDQETSPQPTCEKLVTIDKATLQPKSIDEDSGIEERVRKQPSLPKSVAAVATCPDLREVRNTDSTSGPVSMDLLLPMPTMHEGRSESKSSCPDVAYQSNISTTAPHSERPKKMDDDSPCRRQGAELFALQDLEKKLDVDLFKHAHLLGQNSRPKRVRVPLPSQRREHMRRLERGTNDTKFSKDASPDFARLDAHVPLGTSVSSEQEKHVEHPQPSSVYKKGNEPEFTSISINQSKERSAWHDDDRDLELHVPEELDQRWGRYRFCCGFVARLAHVLPSACGVTPLQVHRAWLAMSYQWLLVLLSILNTVNCVWRLLEDDVTHDKVLQSCLSIDTLMAVGSFIGLLACGALRQSESFVTCRELLTCYVDRQVLRRHWESHVLYHLCGGLMGWAGAIVARLAIAFDDPQANCYASIVGFGFSAAILLGISAYIVGASICLALMVDRFCCNVVSKADFKAAMREWKMIHALCRAVSRTVQASFVTLQITAVAVALKIIAAWGSSSFTKHLVPSVLVFLSLTHASALASRVTDKCARASILVNSRAGDSNFDIERMYVVDYIERSMTGFHIFDVRIASSTLLKCFYVACALAFAVATRTA